MWNNSIYRISFYPPYIQKEKQTNYIIYEIIANYRGIGKEKQKQWE